jgi:hypothetical protein
MIRVERSVDAAIRAPTVVPGDELQPFDEAVRARRSLRTRAPTFVHRAPNGVSIRACIDLSLTPFGIAGVVRAALGVVFFGMPLPPAPHRVTGLVGVATHPITRIGTTLIWIGVWHVSLVPKS